MANRLSIGLNLSRLNGVAVRTTKDGREVMYIDLANCKGFSRDQSGMWWLNLIATESNGRYGDTHFVTPSLTKAQRDELGERGRATIIGNVKPMQQRVQSASSFANDDDDLPFL